MLLEGRFEAYIGPDFHNIALQVWVVGWFVLLGRGFAVLSIRLITLRTSPGLVSKPFLRM